MNARRPRVRKVEPYRATLTTIRAMEILAKQDQAEDPVRELAAEAWHKAGGRRAPDALKVAMVERLLTDRVEYMPDPANVEYLQAPVELLTARYPVGDCDDLSTAAASTYAAMGLHPAYGRLAWELRLRDPFEHVLVVVPVGVRGRRIPAVVDCTYEGSVRLLLERAVRIEVGDPITRPGVPAWSW